MRYDDIKKPLNESEGATCAANVATVAQPFFGELVKPQKEKKAKKSKNEEVVVIKRPSPV